MSPRNENETDVELLKSDSMTSLSDISSLKQVVDVSIAVEEVEKRRTVRFGHVEIRDYNRIVGDHPDVRVGPPMSIGWEFSSRRATSIDEYENCRPKRKVFLRMSPVTRKNMLHNVFGISESEIAAAENEVQKIKRHRDRSNNQSQTSAKVESGLNSFKRKLRRSLSTENMFKGMAAASGSMFLVGIHA